MTRGRVVSFDEARGWGTVDECGPGETGAAVHHPFHCTAIVDGTRTIEEGTLVDYEIVAGRMGRWEATGLRPARP